MGRFRVVRCIGAGGMGQVYEAYDPALARRVALKVMHAACNEDGEQRRLVREAQALARLNHPNVVAVHDLGVHRGRVFLAMELVEGVTLREWLASNPPGAVERLRFVLGVLIQIGEGLAAAHRAGLVQRDLKPSNVLLGDDGRVRVVDFGLAQVDRGRGGVGSRDEQDDEATSTEPALGSRPWSDETPNDADHALFEDRSLTRPGAMVGTPAYMAPEQILGTGVDAATDQFALCVTAWEAVFGVRPFVARSAQEILTAIRRGRPMRPLELMCPHAIEQALRKGLALSVQRRHASAQAIVACLREGRSDLDDAAPRPLRRRRWLKALRLA